MTAAPLPDVMAGALVAVVSAAFSDKIDKREAERRRRSRQSICTADALPCARPRGWRRCSALFTSDIAAAPDADDELRCSKSDDHPPMYEQHEPGRTTASKPSFDSPPPVYSPEPSQTVDGAGQRRQKRPSKSHIRRFSLFNLVRA